MFESRNLYSEIVFFYFVSISSAFDLHVTYCSMYHKSNHKGVRKVVFDRSVYNVLWRFLISSLHLPTLKTCPLIVGCALDSRLLPLGCQFNTYFGILFSAICYGGVYTNLSLIHI